ncbi:hypothetical protein BTHE68_71200 (plasmid) [Burkholderia sp. THE68]|uniref:hypothetical protein n=1 Tax=Burkholderia sp. THE68 TaxID=758782 RepID=UPI001316AF58|nr:hypothetical protein [Burkholderia sp. THE68]BBU33386.1 hypothetical protein BTHE68_71200 [Burkholderia sp. THE68]
MANKIFVNVDGYKVQIFDDEASDVIRFCAQGGGFEKRLPREEFFREFKPFDVPKYSPRNATFEHFDEGVSINAWSNGMSWNGWAMPYFSRDQGMKVIQFFPELRFDAEQDAFVWTDSSMDEEVVYSSKIIETESGPVKAYPIGTGEWTWEWADEEY